jgi:hypothetical protein
MDRCPANCGGGMAPSDLYLWNLLIFLVLKKPLYMVMERRTIKDIDLDHQQKGRTAREVGYHLECIQPVVKNVTQKVKSKTFSQAPDSARMGQRPYI